MDTWRDKYLKRGLLGSGLDSGQVGVFYDDFVTFHHWILVQGTTQEARDYPGGVVWHGGLALPRDTNMGTGSGFGLMHYEGKWYFAVRAKVEDPQFSTLLLGIGGILGPTLGIIAITTSPYNNPNWLLGLEAFQVWQEYLDTGIPWDDQWHDFELWCDGSQYHIRIDGGVTFSYTKTHPMDAYATPITVAFNLKNQCYVNLDKLLCLFPQAV